jgi:hypothetical protein
MFDHTTYVYDTEPEWLPTLFWFIAEIHHRQGIIMAEVKVLQEDLDQLDNELKAATAAINSRIETLVAAGTVPAGSLDALKADVAALAGIGSPAPVA